MIEQQAGAVGIVARLRAIMQEREIFVRAGGTVRFVRVSARLQMLGAAVLLLVTVGLLVAVTAMMLNQQSMSAARSELARERSSVTGAALQAKADRRSVDAVADDLEARQKALEALMRQHFGEDAAQGRDRLIGTDEKAGHKTSDARPVTSAERLAHIRERQRVFAQMLADAASARLDRLEAMIRTYGLKPAQLGVVAEGGPFIPADPAVLSLNAPELRHLGDLLERMTRLESALAVLPSGNPTVTPMLTSSYGYRRDPFNGLPAFHAGLDFPGRYGQPILAASDGRVVYAGPRSGYGNCLEIDHGHGILTRYAHLSGFVARVGTEVARGEQIARMGSTGRSTGTHLHFEVRVNGAAVDPRPFLRERQDVVEARTRIASRNRNVGNRG